MGVLQTGEIFCQAPSAFYLGKTTGTRGIIRENEKLDESIFSLGMSYHNLPCVKNMFERH